MKKISLFFIIFTCLGLLVTASGTIQAADSSFFQGLKTTADKEAGAGYNSFKSAGLTMAKMAGTVFAPAFVGVMGMLLIFYGGYVWMMSRGNEQEVTRGKNIVTNTLIAMIFIFLAWVIVKLIMPLWVKVAG